LNIICYHAINSVGGGGLGGRGGGSGGLATQTLFHWCPENKDPVINQNLKTWTSPFFLQFFFRKGVLSLPSTSPSGKPVGKRGDLRARALIEKAKPSAYKQGNSSLPSIELSSPIRGNLAQGINMNKKCITF